MDLQRERDRDEQIRDCGEGEGKQGSITRLRLQHTGQQRISRDSSSSDRSHGEQQR
jgi:hypothetical protein